MFWDIPSLGDGRGLGEEAARNTGPCRLALQEESICATRDRCVLKLMGRRGKPYSPAFLLGHSVISISQCCAKYPTKPV